MFLAVSSVRREQHAVQRATCSYVYDHISVIISMQCRYLCQQLMLPSSWRKHYTSVSYLLLGKGFPWAALRPAQASVYVCIGLLSALWCSMCVSRFILHILLSLSFILSFLQEKMENPQCLKQCRMWGEVSVMNRLQCISVWMYVHGVINSDFLAVQVLKVNVKQQWNQPIILTGSALYRTNSQLTIKPN